MTNHLTLAECRQLKEWGYPQKSKEWLYEDEGVIRRGIYGYKPNAYCYAVPTVEGMMEFARDLLRQVDRDYDINICSVGGQWQVYHLQNGLVGDDMCLVEDNSPLLALYKLAEQVHKGKDE